MSRRLMALTWLFVFVMAGLLGHLTAQKLHAIPDNSICPLLNTAICPTCINGAIGAQNCHVTSGSWLVCQPTKQSDSCANSRQYECSGVANTAADCTGMDKDNLFCSQNYPACD